MHGNLFSRSSLDGGGTSVSLGGSRDRASRKRLSGGRWPSLGHTFPAPFASIVASESEYERDGTQGVPREDRGDLGGLQGLSWGEKTCGTPPSERGPPSDWRKGSSRCIYRGEMSGKWLWGLREGVSLVTFQVDVCLVAVCWRFIPAYANKTCLQNKSQGLERCETIAD